MQDPHGVSELIRAAKPSAEEGEALKAMRIKVQAAARQLLAHACRLPPVCSSRTDGSVGIAGGRLVGADPFFTDVANALGFGRYGVCAAMLT